MSGRDAPDACHRGAPGEAPLRDVVAKWVRDFRWPDARLVVAVDSYTYHRSPSALADDRERDVSLTLAGIRFLRFTGEQLRRRRRSVVNAVLSALRGADSTA